MNDFLDDFWCKKSLCMSRIVSRAADVNDAGDSNLNVTHILFNPIMHCPWMVVYIHGLIQTSQLHRSGVWKLSKGFIFVNFQPLDLLVFLKPRVFGLNKSMLRSNYFILKR